MAKLTIVIPDEHLEVLRRKALREGSSVDAFLLQHVDRLVLEGTDEEMTMARDPIYALAPAFRSGLADIARQHDHYLYGTPRKR